MSSECSTVGLDVHARSVVAEAVDRTIGQAFSTTLVATESSSGASRSQGSITKTLTPTPDGCSLRPPTGDFRPGR
jgi:hypothetical protein